MPTDGDVIIVGRLVTCFFEMRGTMMRMTRQNETSSQASVQSSKTSTNVPRSTGPVSPEAPTLPIMLTQAIVAAGVMCVCEIICAPLIISMASGAFALVPWIAVACMLAVLFMVILGFAFLWLADNLSHNFAERRAPICYAVIGAIAFGIWGGLLYPTFINSVLEPAGIDPISRGNLYAIVFNCVIVGLVSYLCASLFAERLARRRTLAIVIGIVLVLVALLGAFYLWRFYAMLY